VRYELLDSSDDVLGDWMSLDTEKGKEVEIGVMYCQKAMTKWRLYVEILKDKCAYGL
jgi:hypothetical protein